MLAKFPPRLGKDAEARNKRLLRLCARRRLSTRTANAYTAVLAQPDLSTSGR